MEHTFLVCAFPRSRTQWLARFLSVPGYSNCSFEACEYASSAAEFWANANCYTAGGIEVYGNSDSANIMVLPSILAERPLTRVVWVERPLSEVAVSMTRARIPHTKDSLPTLVRLRDKYIDYFDMIIHFQDLHSPEVCKRLWDFCLPGLPFDHQRWVDFAGRRICYDAVNPMPNKDYTKFLGWAKKELLEESQKEQ